MFRRVLAASFAVLALVVSGLPLPSANATTNPQGNDYSWPQCARGVGNGLGQPLPAGARDFVVVGLTNGTSLHENPCLATQWAYARNQAGFVTGYTMVTYPTRSQVTAARTGHYGTCSTLDCRLRNAGWNEANFTDRSLRRVGAHPALIWLDIEPRHQQPWSTSTARNAAVIRAAVAGLQAKGYAVGLYSTRSLWRSIANYRTSLPEWVPAPAGGCRGSFAGGPVWLSQRTVNTGGYDYDTNARCAAVPAMLRWWQRSHPAVTTGRDRATGDVVARYDGGPAIRLLAPRGSAAVVAATPTQAGLAPTFAVVGADRRLKVRSLASSWVAMTPPVCSTRTPSLVVHGQAAVAECVDAHGLTRTRRIALTVMGSPTGAVVPVAQLPAGNASTRVPL